MPLITDSYRDGSDDMAELPASLMADPDLRPTVKLVLAALYGMTHWSDRTDPFAWPSIADLMRRCGLKRTAVVRAIGEAKSRGIVRSEARYTSYGLIQGYALAPCDENGACHRFEDSASVHSAPGRETGTAGRETGTARPRDGHGRPRDGHAYTAPQAARRARPGRETGTARPRDGHAINPPPNPPANPPAISGVYMGGPTILSELAPTAFVEPDSSPEHDPGSASTETDVSSTEMAPRRPTAPVGPRDDSSPQGAAQSPVELPLFGAESEPKTEKKARSSDSRLSEKNALELLEAQNTARRLIAQRLGRTVRGIGLTPGLRQAMQSRVAEGYTVDQLITAAEVRGRITNDERGFRYSGTSSFWSAKSIDYALGQTDVAGPERDDVASTVRGRYQGHQADEGMQAISPWVEASDLRHKS